MGVHEGIVQVHVRRLDGEPPARGHRLTRVLDEMQDGALELAGIDVDLPERLLEVKSRLDAGADPSGERQLLDEVIEVDESRLQELSAAEGQQLTRELGGPLGAALDEVEIPTRGLIPREPVEQELDPTADHGEHVVELVGDSAGEHAERLDPLGLRDLERLARTPLVGEVDGRADQPRKGAVLPDPGNSIAHHPAVRVVDPAQAILRPERGPGRDRRAERLDDPRPVFGVDAIGPPGAEMLRLRPSGEIEPGPVHEGA